VLGRFEDVARLARQVEAALPGSRARLVRKVAVAEGTLLSKIKLLMALSALVLLAITGLSVGTTLSAMVLERREEIALLKALGKSDGLIASLFLVEAALLGTTSGLLGYGVGFFMSQVLGETLFKSFITPPWLVLPGALLLALATSFAAFSIPVKRVLGLDPAAVLKGE
ncbi:MAG TPA: FtsX-like permease family protein, partial [Alphaproteobacteria bacterium]|nr:FtsX-like permease family protein [Alphaproteobacteria bacterium]